MNNLKDAEKYANRSRGFEYVWDSTVPILDDENKEVKGIRGFMQVCRLLKSHGGLLTKIHL